MIARRRSLVALGACALFATIGAFAQPKPKPWRIGFLYFGSRQSAVGTGRYDAFLRGMRELELVEGRDFVIEWRFADGVEERLPGLLEELLRLKVEILVTTGNAATDAARRATSTLPIVITVQADPVAAGLGKSLARPGGNVTGFYTSNVDTIPKVFELMKLAVPGLSRIAVLANPINTAHPPQLAKVRAMAEKVGIRPIVVSADTPAGIERSFAEATRQRAQGVIQLGDTFFTQQHRQIAELAIKNRLPSIAPIASFTDAGGFLSYGPDTSDNFRRAAGYVDKIFKGAKPGELPFEQSNRYYLTINRRTAEALGLAIPQELLLRADRVIE